MATAVKKPSVRSSNLELFRIITMIMIVAHHYVVNSDIFEAILSAPRANPESIFLILLGAWGKAGINCFVLITGYFMCKSDISGKKYFKLLFEVMFYKIAIYAIFLATGKDSLSLTSLLNNFLPTTSVASGFTDCFLIFYLLIPFINILVNNMDKKQHLTLTGILLFAYTIMAVVPWFKVVLNYITWFFVLYLVASFIRKYPSKVFNNNKVWGIAMVASILLSAATVLAIFLYGDKIKLISPDQPYYFLIDSNKPLSLATAVTSFVFFRNLKLPYIKFINTIGATTYGVLLIHSHSEAMRTWLWNDTLKVMDYYNTPSVYLHAIISVVLVFSVCSAIDLLRIYLIESNVLKLYDKIAAKTKK